MISAWQHSKRTLYHHRSNHRHRPQHNQEGRHKQRFFRCKSFEMCAPIYFLRENSISTFPVSEVSGAYSYVISNFTGLAHKFKPNDGRCEGARNRSNKFIELRILPIQPLSMSYSPSQRTLSFLIRDLLLINRSHFAILILEKSSYFWHVIYSTLHEI